MRHSHPYAPRTSFPAVGLVGFALVLLVHVAVNALGPYGLHRDELLYLAMGEHLRLWAMDFPPFIAIAARLTRALFGDSVTAIRVLPALAHGALVLVAAALAREFGSRVWGQAITALAVLASPLFLRAGNMLQPVVFDQLWWTVALYALVRLISTGRANWWLLLGGALGIGLLTKFSIVFIGVPIVVAVACTPERRWLATRWPYLALALALVIGAPSIVGQFALDFPVRAQMDDLQGEQLQRVTYAAFIVEQLTFGPGTLLAIVGAGALVAGTLTRYRLIGIACCGAFLMLLLLHGKGYYVGPIYPALYAAGAACLDGVTRPRLRALSLGAALAAVTLYGFVASPIALPVLPPAALASYARLVGISKATETNRGEQLPLPQDFADMLGWREMVRAVADVYQELPEHEKADAVLLAANYGEAGALEFYGPEFGLPRVVSPTGSFWFFGPGDKPGRVLVTLGVPQDTLAQIYTDIREAGRFDSQWMVPEERNVPILVARNPSMTLHTLWPRLSGRN
ncbi:MAG TPA: glycosyltransferase family 39 protein [Gemmatimonas sp.]|nr:glycosyltransferase family 39 protein [Gemmatimonas sp.]